MRVALLVPALNEEHGLQLTAPVMRTALESGVVETAVVLDGGSHDATAEVARDHGVEVLNVPQLMPYLGPVLGKGDSLFRGVHTVDADAYVFLDADIGNIALSHVEPLAERIRFGDVYFVKGGFVRVDEHGVPRAVPGGRVTEELARPVLTQLAPPLARLSQPLSGQVAVTATFVRSLSVVTGYGVEIAMLLDAWRILGTDGMCEVDIGAVQNRAKPDDALADVREDVAAGLRLRGGAVPGEAGTGRGGVIERRP